MTAVVIPKLCFFTKAANSMSTLSKYFTSFQTEEIVMVLILI